MASFDFKISFSIFLFDSLLILSLSCYSKEVKNSLDRSWFEFCKMVRTLAVLGKGFLGFLAENIFFLVDFTVALNSSSIV